MLLLKCFAYVGAALFVASCACAGYLLSVSATKVPLPVATTVVSLPQALPIVEIEHQTSAGSSVPSVENDKTDKGVASPPKAAMPAKPKKRKIQKAQVAHQRAPAQQSFAYAPPRQYFFGWR